ncbi:MAG: pyridoxal phosphate-dependent aminotransferase [Phycisphaerae bacterium]
MNLSKRVQSLAESATLAVTARAAQLRSEGVDVISFGAGEPDFATPEHIIEAANKALADGHTKYSKPASGLAAVKKAACAKLKRENNLEYGTDQIVITAGGKNACHLVLQAIVDPGDEVIIPVPYWVSYPEIVKLAGGVPVFVQGTQENNFCVTPQQIRAAMTDRTRALIMNYPSNPAGHMYTPDQIRALADVLRGSEVTVISDEIYDRLIYGGRVFLSFAAVSEDAYQRTVTINSASKTYSMTGWRLGMIAGGRDLVQAAAKLQSQNTSGAVTFAQLAYAAALEGDQSCVEKMRDAFYERGRFVHARLNAIEGIQCNEPQGAFYVFPDVSGVYEKLGVDGSQSFAGRLLNEAHVAVVPGGAFGMDANVRISFATGMDQLEKGLTRLADWIAAA